jgi:hypothetical protein
MKKFLFTLVTVVAFLAGTRTAQINSASAQMAAFTSPVIPFTNQLVIPLTNGLGFTNSLVQVTNVSSLQLSDVLAILMSLQTNVEESLPVLSFLTTNLNSAASSPTNLVMGAFAPITSNPPSLVTPTGAATGAGADQQTSFSMRIGTNIFTIDPPTFQALVMLRDDLEHALPVLQALNGTTPTNATSVTGSPPVVLNTLAPPPITNGFFTPLTNGPPPLIPGF